MALKITQNGKPVIPTRISHYTNLSGLMGMVESGQMWASNVSFLNDRRELQHGLEASLNAIRSFTKTPNHKDWHAALKHAARSLREGLVPNTYAACFCSSADVLSQWRGYGGREQGVSLTFDRKLLSALMTKSKAPLYPVIYGNISTATKMSEALKAELEDLAAFEGVIGLSQAEKDAAAYKAICRLLPQFKHYGFHDERELRYVLQHETVRDDVCFRAAGNVFVPYLKLLPGGRTKLPLLSITVGPGRDQELTQRSLRMYLDKKGYAECDVKLSDVPFRS